MTFNFDVQICGGGGGGGGAENTIFPAAPLKKLHINFASVTVSAVNLIKLGVCVWLL